MVYNGPSKGCRACRKRRVKCDQGKPACNNCQKRKVECPGYESTFDYRHRNETDSTIARAQQKGEVSRRRKSASTDLLVCEAPTGDNPIETSEPAWSPSFADLAFMLSRAETPRSDGRSALSIFTMLDPDPETVVLNWFFSNYPMKCIDQQSSHGFTNLLKPLYLASSPDSPLRPATAAVASNLLMLFCRQGSDTDMARKFYAQSITRMKSMVADPERSKQDDLLLTTLALNFYDTINLRWSSDPTNLNNHKSGAIALLKHRGPVNDQSDVSRHITACLRTALCHWALESGTDVSPDILEWLIKSSVPTNKAGELDMLSFKLVDFRTRFNSLYKLHKRDILELNHVLIQSIIDEGLQLDGAFAEWSNSTPNHWKPLHVPVKELLPSIRQAGAYGEKCAVYWDVSICDLWNNCRTRRLMLLRMVRQLCIDGMAAGLPKSRLTDTIVHVDTTMQRLMDEQCESIPFMVGDVVGPMRHDRLYEINYPFASNGVCMYPNPDHDHPRAAAASGGWFASTSLVAVAKLALNDGNLDSFPMEKVQFDWLLGQLNRLERTFLLGQPKHRDSWKPSKKGF